MNNLSQDMITILQYLLPGFLTAWIFYALTSFHKPSQFERVIQALIFNMFIQPAVFVEKAVVARIGIHFNTGIWSGHSDSICSTGNAIILGILLSYFANNDKFHKVMRAIGITRETSFPSEWFGSFLNVTYIVLHLKDERRLYGWPMEWPSDPDNGHFRLVDVTWLKIPEEEPSKSVEIPITGVDSILVNANDVRWVEFMKKTWEVKNGTKKSKSATP